MTQITVDMVEWSADVMAGNASRTIVESMEAIKDPMTMTESIRFSLPLCATGGLEFIVPHIKPSLKAVS
jgi:hypothetical protein